MALFPQLKTERLILRAFDAADAADAARMAGCRDVASNTLRIPHPYSEEMARIWIASLASEFEKGESVTFAIALSGELIGAISLEITREFDRAELGYWIGKPYWGQGYATEAGHAVLAYGFGELGLNRIFAYHFSRNPASGRVMQKIGMTHEGHLRQHTKKWGVYEDEEIYGILKSDFVDSYEK
ncbi:MAG: GNAT family N-acetyltransferase [Candidatus Sungbacteria bacterium RIFCSPHIGHO2_02_FULL_52_23]|uniref:GNAT family N-acetyltransferase n=1 Tax=Candidatus Sungbacteria bacterium RIFCSPHIGHO2_02_FULL_52_23 TaxID=1802274 RepID=A0A1G2KY19_9BACT|nr:MAG: GNAT family N-acetyltransferase [Candidatus Sungbacteria bacterium RIFCSPHIGHO2_02_FULL_52_23]